MKTSLEHLPVNKQEELSAIKEIILDCIPKTEMIILFGSYARGDWVEDVYQENGTTYEYISDFDILVVTTKDIHDMKRDWKKVKPMPEPEMPNPWNPCRPSWRLVLVQVL